MKSITRLVVVCGCLAAGMATAGSAAPTAGSGTPGVSCVNPMTAMKRGVPLYVYADARDARNPDKLVREPFQLRRYKGNGHSVAGWARSGCWTVNPFYKRVPAVLCIRLRYGWRASEPGGQCQRWHRDPAGRRIMVFRLIRQ